MQAAPADLKNEATLASIAESPDSKHLLLFAVIVDISEPARNEDGANFMTKLKVIDPSFNFRAQLRPAALKFHKFVHVVIFSDSADTAPRIKFVGDVIRLRRFRFRYSARGELRAAEQPHSNWLVYGGQRRDPDAALCCKRFDKNRRRRLSGFEAGRLHDLRVWAEHFFAAHSLRYVSWWSDLQPPSSTSDVVRARVDLILKCVAVDFDRNALEFVDCKATRFTLAMTTPPGLKAGQVIKLSCVDIANDPKNVMVISLTSHSSCLLLPAFFRDFRAFRHPPKPPAAAGHSFLADYCAEPADPRRRFNVVSAVRLAHKDRELTPLARLLDVLACPEPAVGACFLLRCQVTGFLSLDQHSLFKRVTLGDNKVHGIDDSSIKEKKSRVVVNIVFLLRDESLKSDQHLQAYLVTSDADKFMFDSWAILPTLNDAEKWKNLSKVPLSDFIKKLATLKKSENRVKLVVQLSVTKTKKFFFKVVDTIFLDF